jgi:hypothetical protein
VSDDKRRRFAGTFIAALLTLSGSPALAQPKVVPVDAKIVLAVDASRSVDRTELAVERDGYVRALRQPELIRAITAGSLGRVAFAYFEWSGQARDGGLVPWRIIAGPADADRFAEEIAALPPSRSMGTSISRALAFATTLLEDDAVASDRRIIDVSGDGVNNIGPPVTPARDAAVARGITINGLPVLVSGKSRILPDLDRYYEECVIGGPGDFVLPAGSKEEMAQTILRKLIIEISGLEPATRPVAVDYEPIDCMSGERIYHKRMGNPP